MGPGSPNMQVAVNSTWTISGLAMGTAYHFIYNYVTSAGDSPDSPPLHVKTPYNQTETGQLADSIDELANSLGEVRDVLMPGVGSIIAWVPAPHIGIDPPVIGGEVPDGWQRCDGSLITEGIFANSRTPDLNNQGLFLRGGTDSMANTIQQDTIHDHTHSNSLSDGTHSHSLSGVSGSTNTAGSHRHRLQVNGYDLKENVRSSGTGNGFETEDYYDYWTSSQCESSGDHSHSFSISGDTASHTVSIYNGMVSGSFKTSEETRPKNMAVVYIIRIK